MWSRLIAKLRYYLCRLLLARPRSRHALEPWTEAFDAELRFRMEMNRQDAGMDEPILRAEPLSKLERVVHFYTDYTN